MKNALRHTVCLLACLALAGWGTALAQPAPDSGAAVQFTGLLDHPLRVSAGDLALRVEHQQKASFESHQGPQTHSFQGVSLYGLLRECGIQADRKRSGGLLDRYLLATGADGYQAVFSLGEMSDDFGRKDVLLATRIDADAGGRSVLYTTAPGDAKGGRYVANLAFLEVRAAPYAADSARVAQGSVLLSGAVQKTMTLDTAALGALPQTIEKLGDVEYRGVGLWALLNEAGVQPDSQLKNAMLSMFVVAEGRDGYRAVFSMAELSPEFGNAKVLIAVQAGPGGSASVPPEIRLVVPEDGMHARSVRQLVSLKVETARPARQVDAVAL